MAAVIFALGWQAGSSAATRKAYAALWRAIIDLPDPERCALCGEGVRYHAPCLINLSTGELGEMRVYSDRHSRQGEIDPPETWETGTLHLLRCAGVAAIQDTCDFTCKVFLPAERELMNPALFCGKCRRLLAGAGLEGYVIVDLYDLAHIRAHPLRYEAIRDYQISVAQKKDGTEDVCVTGLLKK